MKTSQQFIECLDCQELYFLVEKGSQYFLRSPESRKTIIYHVGLLCPGCQGTLISSSFKQMNQISKDRKKEITHLKLLQGDLRYKIDSLQAERERLEDINKLLQKRLDDARQTHFPKQAHCLRCDKAVVPGKRGRTPDYCSNACKQKAYRERRLKS